MMRLTHWATAQFYYSAQQLQQVDIMYDNHFLPDQIKKEADLYDDLSLFIKTFKKILTLSHEIKQNLDQEPPILAINELKNIPKTQQQLSQQYDARVQENSPNKNTINRFICRLYETLCLFKSNNYQRNKAALLYKQFLDKNELAITSYQLDKNVGKMYKRILNITQKFCHSCQIILKQGFQEDFTGYFSQNSHKQLDDSALLSPLVTRKGSPYKSQSNFHKAMVILNKRFSTLSCLDLDYNSYKTYYFQARSQKEELEKDYLQRNGFTWKYISSYSKQFSQYLKKKEKTSLNRKNRFKEKLQTAFRNQAEIKGPYYQSKNNKQQQAKGDCFILKEAKQTQLPILYKSPQKDDSPEKKNQFGMVMKQVQTRKTHYHIKNVYLTLNKINPSNKSSFLANDNKKLTKNTTKEKYQQYSSFKVGKVSHKVPRIIEVEKIKPRPLLQIRQIESRDYGYTLDNSILNDNTIKQETKGTYMNPTKRLIAEKKSIKLNQLLNKSSFNSKLHKAETLNEDDLMCNFRMNYEEQQTSTHR